MYLFTTNRSKILDRTGTTEMGLKSPGPTGVFVLATGRMRATRHCSGMVEELSDWLKRRAIQPEHIGASRRRNQAGKRSRPSAVGFRPSRMKKISGSVKVQTFGEAVALSIGGRYSVYVEAAA